MEENFNVIQIMNTYKLIAKEKYNLEPLGKSLFLIIALMDGYVSVYTQEINSMMYWKAPTKD